MTDTGPWSALRTGEDTDFSVAVLPQPKHRFARNLTCTCPMMVLLGPRLSEGRSTINRITRLRAGYFPRLGRRGSPRVSPVPLSADRDVSAGELRPTPDRSDPLPRRVARLPVVNAAARVPATGFLREDRTGSPEASRKRFRIPSVAASEEGRAQRRIPVRPADAGNVAYRRPLLPGASIWGLSPSDRGPARGWCEASNGPCRAGVQSSQSRVVWECSPKRVSARRIQPGGRFLPRCVRIPKRGSAPGFKFRRRAHFFRRRCAATVSGSAWKGGAKVATGLAAVSFTAPRPLLAVSRGRGQSARCVMLPAGSTGPPDPGATVDRSGLSPVRVRPASRRRVGTGSRKLASGVSGNVGNPPDPS
ncbi:hypothetical protein DPEC_G00361280 [Dallia pectoralis]|uniref:Uncharacterized protein n=1 Tax=Dallia pectoralis TaxID=75939 RepID=A0ACC2F138_DALPE|nr:hypothetical protein DPEC_G00361280 [Dallia pectoralis]